ncbi:MAG: transposase [Candidatus Kapabacteria bacterium]|nr:transposase [Candidatus Kapabacteria bacterium]
MSEHISLGRIHMKPPRMETLLEHLNERYPHATLHFAYATKSDAVDSRKIAEALRAQALHSIWIPTEEQEGDRALVRYRATLVQALRSTKTRIKQRLLFHGVVIPPELDNGSWTKRLRQWLASVQLADPSAQPHGWHC